MAIWLSSKSRWAFFWAAVCRRASGTIVPLLVRSLRGLAEVCFCQAASRKGTKLLSSERTDQVLLLTFVRNDHKKPVDGINHNG